MIKQLLLLVILIVATPWSASAESWPDTPFLVTDGRASVDVEPETATIKLTLLTFESSSEQAITLLQTQIGVVLETLRQFEIAPESIESFHLHKDAERARREHRDTEILGYYASRTLQVDIDDLDVFADLVAALAAIDNVTNIDADFDIHDRDAVAARLTLDAGKDARAKAENMAAAMEVTVGPVHAITKSDFSFGRSYYGAFSPSYAVAMDAAPGRETVFRPATIPISQRISVIFEIDQ